MEMSMTDFLALLLQYGERDEDMTSDLTGAQPHTSLRELGFDSLGIFNVTVQISDRHGVTIPYDEVVQADSPVRLLEVINKALSTETSG